MALFVLLYPIVMLAIAAVLNIFVIGVSFPVMALPSSASLAVLSAAIAILIINHTWLMTTTELTRGKYKLFATPEEWVASGTDRKDASEEGLRELERRHNAHRNTTENVVYFGPLAVLFIFTSAPLLAVYFWVLGFAVARVGHTLSYLLGADNARGLFMSVSLVALYGMASYLMIGLAFHSV